MNKIQENLLKSLGLELEQEFGFDNMVYKFTLGSNGELFLMRKNTIDNDWYHAPQSLLLIINDYNKIYPIKKPILDEVEKKYLENVLRPFKDKVSHISLIMPDDNNCFISIEMKNINEVINFPNFKFGTMYKGMEVERSYTLKELGLFEE